MLGILAPEQIEKVLQENFLGRLGCSSGNKIYVVPVSYVYDGKYIYGHSLKGMKIEMMERNPNVCFQVDVVKTFTNWQSVIVWGQYEEITGTTEKNEAMKMFVDRMLRMKVSETAIPPDLSPTRVHPRSPGFIHPVVYRIAIAEKTGRYEKE